MSRTIAIVGGTGPLGLGLASRWARAGETIIIGSREAARAESVAEGIASQSGKSSLIRGAANAAAVAASEIVVLTVPFEGQASLLKDLKTSFKPGTVVVDATVPLAASVGGRATRTLGVWQGSAAQQAAELLPGHVKVAAAFHSVSAELLKGEASIDCDVLVCTDDDQARQIASELAEKIPGVRAINAGALENARIVEQITALLITLNIKHRVHSAGLRITGLPSPRQT
jgi:8-hydroxy-5-deazaflavin:NADPH oxidoreductase